MTSRFHIRTARERVVALAAVALAGTMTGSLAGCTDEDDGFSKDSLLRFVPADTPYVIATGEPLDDEFIDALEPQVDALLATYRDFLALVVKGDESEDGQAFRAVLTEISPLFTLEGLEQAGIDRHSQMVFYGHGMLPVLRIAVGDPEAFENTIAGIEEAAGESMSSASIDDTEYRYLDIDEARFILGTFEGSALVTVMPADFDDNQLRQLLGLELPARSLAATSILPDIVREHGYTRHYVGFVDTLRLADTFLGDPGVLDTALLARLEFDPARIPDVCKDEIRQVAAIAPRAVFGYDEISPKRISGSLVVELRDDIATGMQGLAAVVPGLGKDHGGILSLGASINLTAFRDFYAARLDAMEANPFECEYFAEIQAGVPKAREALNQPLPPVVYGIRGFNAVIDSLDVDGLIAGQPPAPGSIEAGVVVAMQDAQSLVAMGAMFSPELAALNLQPDGQAVALALPQVEAMGLNAYAAMVDDALAIAVGPAAQRRAAEVVAAEAVTPTPVFAMNDDGDRYYEFIAAMNEKALAEEETEGEPVPPELAAAMQDMFTALGDLYDRMSTAVRFTEHGMVVESTVTLKDSK